ncbi:lytic transglycosylase domain-containing protein [Magnetococcus sp. PR-3]|uniref:lytic transglycosylase domain-containing protein n=1 Tax=Magnetococcus sp. PR-3 TaxID=3120355 RepID=UPI002FCDE37D
MIRLLGFSALLMVLCTAAPAAADIYAFVDANGVIHLSDRANDPRYRRLMRINKHGQRLTTPTFTARSSRGGNPKRFESTIRNMAKRYGLDAGLVKAVIRAESDFDPNVVSHKGAVGLMQLMPQTARMYGVSDRTDPQENIQAGSRHLRYLMRKYKNNIKLTLAAYNAGEGAVRRYGNRIPPYRETQNYVRKVIRFYKQYR